MIKGFTLLETIIGLAIAVVIFTVLTTIFITQYNLWNTQNTAGELQTGLTNTLRLMQEFGGSANAVVSSKSFGGIVYVTDEDTLILEMPGVDASYNPLTAKDYAVFYLDSADSKKLLVQMDADPASARKDLTKLLTSAAETLQFRYNKTTPTEATSVEIFVSLKKVYKDNTEETSGTTTVFLRNK